MSSELFGMNYSVLRKLLYPKQNYNIYEIKKKNGGKRVIHVPEDALKKIQTKLLEFLYDSIGEVKDCVHGFTPKRSIVTNASQHCSSRTNYLLNIDIQDFFPSINFFRVRGLFQSEPFSFSHSVASVLAQICTYKNQLPQGAPTSPLVANLICRSLDNRLIRLARKNKVIYTRYSDDITFSFSTKYKENLPKDICFVKDDDIYLGEKLTSIFDESSFLINPKKTRLSHKTQRLEVTGIKINEFPNVKRIFIDKIRGGLHAWDKYGYHDASEKWKYIPYVRQRRERTIPPLAKVLHGKLLYLKMVRGQDDYLYSRLAERFNNLAERDKIDLRLSLEYLVHNDSDIHDAVFVVEWSGDYGDYGFVGSQATAFAYKNIGLVTCAHFFKTKTEKGEEISFEDVDNATLHIKHPRTGKKSIGICINKNDLYDLALIRFEDVSYKHKYFVSKNDIAKVDQECKLIGFPDWKAKKQANIVSSKVLNYFEEYGQHHVEIGETIRLGNSGGPLIDNSYNVIGVALKGATQSSGTNQCLCVSDLSKWLTDFIKR